MPSTLETARSHFENSVIKDEEVTAILAHYANPTPSTKPKEVEIREAGITLAEAFFPSNLLSRTQKQKKYQLALIVNKHNKEIAASYLDAWTGTIKSAKSIPMISKVTLVIPKLPEVERESQLLEAALLNFFKMAQERKKSHPGNFDAVEIYGLPLESDITTKLLKALIVEAKARRLTVLPVFKDWGSEVLENHELYKRLKSAIQGPVVKVAFTFIPVTERNKLFEKLFENAESATSHQKRSNIEKLYALSQFSIFFKEFKPDDWLVLGTLLDEKTIEDFNAFGLYLQENQPLDKRQALMRPIMDVFFKLRDHSQMPDLNVFDPLALDKQLALWTLISKNPLYDGYVEAAKALAKYYDQLDNTKASGFWSSFVQLSAHGIKITPVIIDALTKSAQDIPTQAEAFLDFVTNIHRPGFTLPQPVWEKLVKSTPKNRLAFSTIAQKIAANELALSPEIWEILATPEHPKKTQVEQVIEGYCNSDTKEADYISRPQDPAKQAARLTFLQYFAHGLIAVREGVSHLLDNLMPAYQKEVESIQSAYPDKKKMREHDLNLYRLGLLAEQIKNVQIILKNPLTDSLKPAANELTPIIDVKDHQAKYKGYWWYTSGAREKVANTLFNTVGTRAAAENKQQYYQKAFAAVMQAQTDIIQQDMAVKKWSFSIAKPYSRLFDITTALFTQLATHYLNDPAIEDKQGLMVELKNHLQFSKQVLIAALLHRCGSDGPSTEILDKLAENKSLTNQDVIALKKAVGTRLHYVVDNFVTAKALIDNLPEPGAPAPSVL